MLSTLKRIVVLASTGLALSIGGAALTVPAASAQPVSPAQPRPVSVTVSGAALCGTRYLPSGVTRYQPAQLVRYSTRNEVRLAPVQFNGRYFLTLRLVPRQGEQAFATVYCRNGTRFNRFVFINGFNRSQIQNLVGVTRIVRGRP